MPPASTSRTSRRLAKSRKGDATEEKNKNVLVALASTDVKALNMNTAEEDFFSEICGACSTAEGTRKFHMREKSTLPKTLFLPHVRQRGKRQREEQAQLCIYGI